VQPTIAPRRARDGRNSGDGGSHARFERSRRRIERRASGSHRDAAPATADRPSTLKVVIPFTDPVMVGKFVYHCHAADHEDKGMMGVIEVVM